MKQQTAHVLKQVFSLGIFGFVKKIVENRKAVNAGNPRPHPVGELIGDAVTLGTNAALPAVKNERVRDALQQASDAAETIRDLPTPNQRPRGRR